MSRANLISYGTLLLRLGCRARRAYRCATRHFCIVVIVHPLALPDIIASNGVGRIHRRC